VARHRLALYGSYLLAAIALLSAHHLPPALAPIVPHWGSFCALLALVFAHVASSTRPTIAVREDRWTWVLALVTGGACFTLSLAWWESVQPGWDDEIFVLTPGSGGLQLQAWRLGLLEALDKLLLGPLLEELLFHGIYWSLLAAHRPRAFVLVVTTILFGLIHQAGSPVLINLPPHLAAGALLGVVRIHSRSFLLCFVAHAVGNTLVVLWLS
jgi:membrane protease YdiL (CAAX protease family)